MSRFKNKVAIVTGGATGIGQAITEGLVAGGAKVVITGRRQGPLEELAGRLGASVAYIAGDIGKTGTSRKAVDKALSSFGRLDFVVNNAAAAELLPLADCTDEIIEQMLSVNIKGTICLIRDATSELEKTKGAIVNISSVAGQQAVPGMAVYSATKSAGDRLTKVLANELGPLGIRINTVAPGLTKTAMFERTMGPAPEAVAMMVAQTALRRTGMPADVAPAALWLLSEDAGWITGQILQASGGLMIA